MVHPDRFGHAQGLAGSGASAEQQSGLLGRGWTFPNSLGNYEANIRRSTDYGQTWSCVWETRDSTFSAVYSIVAYPDGQVWYAGAGGGDGKWRGVLKSTAGGVRGSWTFLPVGVQDVKVMDVAVDFFDSQLVLALLPGWYQYPNGIYRSNDGGANWENVWSGHPGEGWRLRADPRRASNFWLVGAGVAGGPEEGLF